MKVRRKPGDRRARLRFPLHRELRFKVLEDGRMLASGHGETVNMSSSGVAFQADSPLVPGCFIELSVSWPVMLDGVCPMRIIVFGQVLRSEGQISVCTIEKWEFRTQARTANTQVIPMRTDGMLQRWADYRRETMRAAATA
jgi:hypothetical protein